MGQKKSKPKNTQSAADNHQKREKYNNNTTDEAEVRPPQSGDSTETAPPQGRDVMSRPKNGTGNSRNRKSFYETIDASEVLPHLIIGNLASSKNEGFLSRKNVKYILNLTNDLEEFEGIEYQSTPLEDDDDQQLSPHLESCFEFINKAARNGHNREEEVVKGTVLVHSYFGMSRSSAIIIAYLMKEKNWKLREAYGHLKERHSSVNPNDNFIVQLIHYEQELFDGRMTMTITDFRH